MEEEDLEFIPKSSTDLSYEEIVQNDTVYSDIDLRMNPHPVNGSITILKETRAVKAAVKNLILTEPGEKPFKPNYGTPLRKYLFEISTILPGTIEGIITRTLKTWEPRIELKDVQSVVKPETHSLEIYISFVIKNIKVPDVIEIYLKRTR